MGRRKKIAMVQPVPQGPSPNINEAPQPQQPTEPAGPEEKKRERKNGDGPACPRCGVTDTFVRNTIKGLYPLHIEMRFRNYQCGQCLHVFAL